MRLTPCGLRLCQRAFNGEGGRERKETTRIRQPSNLTLDFAQTHTRPRRDRNERPRDLSFAALRARMLQLISTPPPLSIYTFIMLYS